ncbi:hypothetical protein [Bacillus mojavensis]|uniref:hypothetical protein n=1 Tax=Bacillus mojavensis TaxID=72360 RepID=UPI002DB5FF47|nr:hypothetical protein [Bacillus mojavensis]MEC1612194.1 hypothetical protein [Bacillus mojavensis]MEC1623226.1 hypothetical protein [Bacillus mojavensis]MEC1659441.1 hypothetical protein [Bacillus mojavensis]MEC1683321.1 hypothetical protein [Bacillus mojavensis]MEC1693702.1 hypothetical protein [Bacillus mojavensis]
MKLANKFLSHKLLAIATALLVSFCVYSTMGNYLLDITSNTTLNAAMATQIVNWLNAGLGVWTILGMLATGNLISVGVLLTAKAMLKKMTAAVVIAW